MMQIRTGLLPVVGAVLLFFGSGCAGEREDVGYAGEMAEQHEGDAPEPTGIVQEPGTSVQAEEVAYGVVDGQTVTGYMAWPSDPDSVAEARGLTPGDTALPAVMLVHEWWGLNENIRTMARRLAGEGFRVLAVDLYGDSTATTPERAQTFMAQALEDEEAMRLNMRAAYEYLKQEYGAPKVAVMGWCFGGMVALRTAVDLPAQLDGAVIYYGHIGDVGREQLAELEMPVVGFFGAEDTGIPLDDVRTFEQTLDELGKDAEVYVYDDAGHAFANPSGRNYNEEAAADAWEKTLAFLNQHLYDT